MAHDAKIPLNNLFSMVRTVFSGMTTNFHLSLVLIVHNLLSLTRQQLFIH
jgi:hypothetical protein